MEGLSPRAKAGTDWTQSIARNKLSGLSPHGPVHGKEGAFPHKPIGPSEQRDKETIVGLGSREAPRSVKPASV